MFTEHTDSGEGGSVSNRLLLTGTPTVSTLLPISFAPLLALVLTVTNDSVDMPTASCLRGRSARLLTGMLAVTTPRLVPCPDHHYSVDKAVSLHPQ
jgi:hypothetical protein